MSLSQTILVQDNATGRVISQKLPDGLWHPIAYRSQTMSDAEWNYHIYDREMLAIVRADATARDGKPNPLNE